MILSCLRTDDDFSSSKLNSGWSKEAKKNDILFADVPIDVPEYINTQTRVYIDLDIKNRDINRILITGENVIDKLISFDVQEIKSLNYISFYLPDASGNKINIIGIGKNNQRLINLRKKVEPRKVMVISL